jgi:PAS domain S-box-containing protein
MPLIRILFKDRSLWYKLTLLSVLPAVIVTVAIVFQVMDSIEKRTVMAAKNKADTFIDLMRLSMSNAFVVYNKDLLDNFVDGLSRVPGITYAMVVDSSDNRILAHNDHRMDGRLIKDTTGAFGSLTGSTDTGADGWSPDDVFYAGSAAIAIQDQQYATLHIGFSFSKVHQQMASVEKRIWQITLLSILFGSALSLFTAKLISIPIRGLAQQAKLAGRGDFKQTLTYQSKDAIGQLAESFNQMVADIKTEIQERKDTEKALRKSEEEYRHLIERANDGILIIQDGLIQFANPRAIAMSGEAPEDFIGSPFSDYLHPDEQEKIKRFYEQRMAQNDPASIYETIFVRKDGALIYAEVNGNLTTYLDRPADLVVIRDITERRRAREALKEAYDQLEVKVSERTAELAIAKERAEESDRLKSAFLAAMSHELRTPLNSIIGFSGIILQEMVGPLNDEQNKQLTMVKESAHHLLSLINEILDISKIEAGQLAVASELFDIKAVVDRVIRTVTPMAQQKGLKIDAHVDPQVRTIVSDRRRVEQILLNLVHNAVKFTLDGQVTLKCETKGSWVTTSVKDTGIGIAPNDLEKVFAAFQQLETGLSRRFEGTGLGLSICKKLVKLLGGEIHAYSEGLDQGAVFTFTLPAGERL